MKKILMAFFLGSLSFVVHAGGGDAGDFGDGIVLSPYIQPYLPQISIRNCWTEWKPVFTYENGYWSVRWVQVEVCG